MGIFTNWFKKKEPEQETRGLFCDSLMYNMNGGYTTNKAMLLSTVYRCVDVISDAVAQLPLEPYYINDSGYKEKFIKHPTYYLLNKEPNQKMSRFTFIKTLIVSTLLKGNGYAYIERDAKGDAVALHYLQPDYVTITEQKDGIKYSVVGIKGLVEPCNMIHILNFSYDGITGISTLQHARQTLGLATDSESHAQGFFKGGANLAGILKVQSTLTGKQKADLKTSWQTAFSPTTGTPNGVAVLEGNMDFQPITVNPADAQLLETRQFNVIDICRFLSPLLEKIELEFERKLYKPSERSRIDVRFDTSVLLRADKQSLANYYNTLFNIGVVSANEIRKQLDLPAVDGGDSHFVQVNLMEIKNAANNIPSNNNIINDTDNLQGN